jgi:hypothetical protein
MDACPAGGTARGPDYFFHSILQAGRKCAFHHTCAAVCRMRMRSPCISSTTVSSMRTGSSPRDTARASSCEDRRVCMHQSTYAASQQAGKSGAAWSCSPRGILNGGRHRDEVGQVLTCPPLGSAACVWPGTPRQGDTGHQRKRYNRTRSVAVEEERGSQHPPES